MRTPSDAELADIAPKTRFWRRNGRYLRFWEMSMFVRNALREKGLDEQLTTIEFENTVQRVTHIIRSRNAKKAVKTRRRERERKRQLPLPL